MNDGMLHPERSSDGTEGVASAEKGIISNIISGFAASPFSN